MRPKTRADGVFGNHRLGVSRNTVREYVAWFETEKLLPGDAAALPSAAELDERLARTEPVAPPPRLMPYHDEIAELVGAGLQVREQGRPVLCGRMTGTPV